MLEPHVDSRVVAVAERFRAFLENPSGRALLDEFAADVMQLGRELIERDAALFKEHFTQIEPRDVVTAMVGWALGFSGADISDPKARVRELGTQVLICAYIAPWSAEDAARATAHRRPN